jgi:hypothetical protein
MWSGYSSSVPPTPSLTDSYSRAASPSGQSDRSWCSHTGIFEGILGRPEKRMFFSNDLCTLDESLESELYTSSVRTTAPTKPSERERKLHRHPSGGDDGASIRALKGVERAQPSETLERVKRNLRAWFRCPWPRFGIARKTKRALRQDSERIKMSPR